MKITDDVNLPDPLIAAAAEEDLVLFVGAGASMNSPADLPSFGVLAAQLAEATGNEFDKHLEPDAYIGRLCDSDATAREHVRAIIANPNSRPNEMHRAIVQLSNACGTIRIVSTNYDEHLSTAATELSTDIGDVYQGPAVPVGRSFKGLVYLHGRVSRPSAELVITDSDFGRAYLFDGWARRFVTDLFLNRTVLFIGYSHNDTVMKYLARGLPSTTKRFALTDTPHDLKWNDLGVIPVEYPAGAEHTALTKALREWARRLEMGQLDHHSRILEIVTGGPPKLPVEEDYLAFALSLPVGVRTFTENARGEDWLLWAEQQPAFLSLFAAGDQTTDEGRVLARWFAKYYVADFELADLALATIARRGPIVCKQLRQEIAFAAYDLRESSPELSIRWSVIVAAALRTHEVEPDESRVLLFHSAITDASVLPFLRRALHPRLELNVERPWNHEFAEASVRIKASVRWSTSNSNLHQLLEAACNSSPEVAASTLQILEQSLNDAYQLLAAFSPNKMWDSWSFRRSAIEPHEQDKYPTFESTIIDALRDTSVRLIDSDGSIVERWLKSDFGLFRRLGLHLVIEHPAMSAHEKLGLLISESHLYDRVSKHEVFRLLEVISPKLSDNDRELLLERILEGPPSFDIAPEHEAELHERCIFDIAQWLSRFVRGWDEIDRAVAAIRKHRPTIGVREHPDFNSWMDSGTWVEEAAPFAAEEFVEAFDKHGPAVATMLAVDQTYSELTLDGPTWQGACTVVQQIVENRPDIGLALLTVPIVAEDPAWEGDFRAALITGLGNAKLKGGLIERALSALAVLVRDVRLARPISDFCLSAMDSKASDHSELVLTQLDDLAGAVWHNHASGVEERDSDDWLMLGLNTWPGVLAQYWLSRIRVQWKAQGESWHGLSPADKKVATRLLNPVDDATQASLAIIAADTYFLFSADPVFGSKQLFPLFEATTGHRAAQVWMSYLHHPRVNDSMLESGFWQVLISAHNLVADLNTQHGLESQYWRMMALICIRSEAEVIDAPAFFCCLTRSDQATSFITAMADLLHEIDEAESTKAWNTWIARTANSRVSQPHNLIPVQERTAWGDMALRMPGGLILEALELTNAAPGPLGQNTTFDNLSTEVTRTQPDRIAHFITRRLEHTSQSDWHIERELADLETSLRQSGVSPPAIRGLAEQALRIGIYNAASWT